MVITALWAQRDDRAANMSVVENVPSFQSISFPTGELLQLKGKMMHSAQLQKSGQLSHPVKRVRGKRGISAWIAGLTLLFLISLLELWRRSNLRISVFANWSSHSSGTHGRLVRNYHIHSGVGWMNPDGGRWRVMYTCDGQSPCPTLYAEEGDLVELTVTNDVYTQSSIHWSGIGYKGTGSWNDGVAGLSQFPMLSRGNYTSVVDTAGSWGLSWYAEHTTAASADGLYGMVYVAPSPSRPRPYKLITNDEIELRQMMEAEKEVKHIAIKNHQHRDSNWKLLRMRAEGSEFHCSNSILVNGKGRVHCRQPGFEKINGHSLDENGCLQPPGMPQESCEPSSSDYEIIETEGRSYIMLNLVNIGFEHSVVISVDKHKMIAIANNGGFVSPSEADVVYVPSAGRITVLIKLDAEPGDYAVRVASTSQLQRLQGYAILRCPAKRRPVYGEPMKLPQPASPDDICVLADGSAQEGCKKLDGQFLPPYPPSPPPSAQQKSTSRLAASSDLTFHLAADSRPSRTEPHVTEYFLNEQPWQLFHSAMTPLLFRDFSSSTTNAGGKSLQKPLIDGIPMGSVVDLIIENRLNDTIPLYKHGEPAWLIGARANARFPHSSVEEAIAEGRDAAESLNLRDPAIVTVHDLPPLGWSVLRFKVTAKAATMIHAVKLRYFVLGMSAPILEGILPGDRAEFPDSAVNRPHVSFEPKNDGVFG